jgi:hypothetical protein
MFGPELRSKLPANTQEKGKVSVSKDMQKFKVLTSACLMRPSSPPSKEL